MEARKLQAVGNKSHTISLPKRWIEQNKLKAKDPVFVETTANQELLIRTSKAPENDQRLEVKLEEIIDIETFVAFCYTKNIQTVVIRSKKFDIDSLKRIKKSMVELEGYDVVNESATKVEISFLFQDINITIPKLLRRMFYLLSMMVESIKKTDLEALEEIEHSIDKLYNLSKRILFQCQIDTQLRAENSINNYDDIFFLRDICKKCENLADSIRRLRRHKTRPSELQVIESYLRYVEASYNKKQQSQKNHLALNSSTHAASSPEKQAILNVVQELCSDVIENLIYLHMNERYFSS